MTTELSKDRVAIFFIMIFHIVGIIGLLGPYKDLVQGLTALHLLVCFGFLMWRQKDRSGKFILASTAIFVLGFSLEWIGVYTGFPFGNYAYGSGFGWRLDAIPVMIGLNWLLLIYSVSVLMNKLPLPVFLSALLGAIIMVGLDFLIEPIAPKLDFWYWHRGKIPSENYWGWFGYSFLLLIFYNMIGFKKENKVAYYYFGFQALFFILLNIFL